MGALPKHKVSKRREGYRRRHQYLKLPQLMTCPACGERKPTHLVCPNCGTYRGRQVIESASARRQRRADRE
jgi:large subunit ribosomal protein L32